jgi:hypothetical protein
MCKENKRDCGEQRERTDQIHFLAVRIEATAARQLVCLCFEETEGKIGVVDILQLGQLVTTKVERSEMRMRECASGNGRNLVFAQIQDLK